jgi:hypothetical protein
MTLLFLYVISPLTWSYELVVIKAIANEKHSFVTRNQSKNNKTFVGQKVTFTSDNVTLIARASDVTAEFVKWEIVNDFTDVPFRRGEVVTMYDTTEYLWTLTPEKIKLKYLKKLYKPRRSIEFTTAFSKGISESVTQTIPQSVNRGGMQFEATFRKEFNTNYSLAYGFRYSKDIVNLPSASVINTRFIGLVEGRYYFDPMEDFHDAQVGLGLAFGFGQSRSETSGQVSFGNAVLIPATKLSLMFPINKNWDFELISAFESLRLDESNANNADQTTNLVHSKAGIMLRKHLN